MFLMRDTQTSLLNWLDGEIDKLPTSKGFREEARETALRDCRRQLVKLMERPASFEDQMQHHLQAIGGLLNSPAKRTYAALDSAAERLGDLADAARNQQLGEYCP